ncbi:MAG: type II secretion system protein [Candidatus Staskawiczbacteria bacterium]|nr:type II secretion system protein [Candidatus Staskawiczbacteria bacterium]
MNKIIDYKLFNQKGFSLLELVIVLTILVIVIGITSSIFVAMIQNQGRSLKEQEMFSQISYALENFSKMAQTAKKDVNGSCLGSGFINATYLLTHFNASESFYDGVKFINKENECVEFFLDTSGFFKQKIGALSPQNILSTDFDVEYLRFVIDGNKSIQASQGGDLTQHRLSILMKATINDSRGPQTRVVQTTVSPLELNTP